MNVNGGGSADVVFTGGAVYTVNDSRPWARAVAVRGGRIVSVGADADVRSLVGPRTEVVDLGGRMLLPGFQDAHVHPGAGGLAMIQCFLNPAHSLEEYRSIVRSYAEGHPEVPWIAGEGWSMDVFPGGTPSREELDVLVPDRPAFIANRDGHGAWVNSRALAIAGVTAGTPDPADGRIERGPDGEPSGTLHEGAMDLVLRLVPKPGDDEMRRALLAAQSHLHSLGITAWQDAMIGSTYDWAHGYDVFDTYLGLAERGELTARVVGALWWDHRLGDEQLEGLLDMRGRASVGRFRATSVKIMQDGVCENYTAGMLEPYLERGGRVTGNRGLSFVEPEALRAAVARLDGEGFQVHFHAIGDRAVRECLDAVESARSSNGMNDLRHHISHIQVIHPDDVARFASLGVVANAQPLWACHEPQMDELTIPFLGPERATRQYPFGSLLRAGARLAFGSDWSVSSADPLEEMFVAVNRRQPPRHTYGGGSDEVLLPEERITLAEAIHAFTLGSAHVNHLEEETGSIEVGKRADLTVVDRNLFDRPTDEIADARVELTLVEGERVHATGGFA